MPTRSLLGALVLLCSSASAHGAPSPVAKSDDVPTATTTDPDKRNTARPKIVAPRYTLQVQFVRTADDDGGRPSTLTQSKAIAAIDAANVVFRRNGGDVAFAMHPDSNFADLVKSTTLNRDCLLAQGQTAATITANTDHSIDPNTLCDGHAPHDARTAYGLERGDRIVVFSRGGNESVAWHSDGHWYLDEASGGQSGGTQAFVRMPATFGGSTLLAHELGHYLHNPHTFDDALSIGTVSDAREAMEAWVADHPGDHPSKVFDGDSRSGYPVNDTPPDPRGGLLAAVHAEDEDGDGDTDEFDKCAPDVGSVTIAIRVNGKTKRITLTPDRSNVMSYFKGCPLPQHFSDDQYANIHAALAGNRRDLVAQGSGGCYGTSSGGGVIATLRKIAACKLLVRRPMPGEDVMGEIYSQPGDLKPGFTKIGTLGVHRDRERALVKALRAAPACE
jgi:hypothetical protein